MFDFLWNKFSEEILFEDFHWAIEKYSAFDYWEKELVAWALNIEKLPGLKIKNSFITYDQREVHRNSCTSESWNTILSNTFEKNLDIKFRKAKWDEFVKLWADPSYGWYISKAVDADRNIWNKDHETEKVATFCIETNSEMFWKLYDKWYMFKYWYKWNSLFNKDKDFEWILNETTSENIWKRTYWHSISWVKTINWNKNLDMNNVDNYSKRKYNIYQIENFQVSRFSLFFANSYFYIPESHLKMENVKIKAEEKRTDIIAKELWLWNWLNWEKNMTRQEWAFMIWRLALKIHKLTLSKEMIEILWK